MKTMRKIAVAAAMTLLFAGTATAASADSESVYVPYLFNGEAAYIFGNPSDLLPGSPGASPDTGYVRITNNGTSTFTGSIGFTAWSPCVGDRSRYYSVTLAPGDHVSVQVTSESSNDGGFNGTFCNDMSTPQLGAQFTMTGTVTLGSASASVDLSIYDRDMNYILQGASPYGQDLGDPVEVAQPTQYFTFQSTAPAPVWVCDTYSTSEADDVAYDMHVPYPVRLGSLTYDSLYISTNGALTFGYPDATWSNYPGTASISFYGNDWVTWNGGHLSWGFSGRNICVTSAFSRYPDRSGPQYTFELHATVSATGSLSGTLTTDHPGPARMGIRYNGEVIPIDFTWNTAFLEPFSAPAAPASVSATPADAQATVTWTAPASDGGTPITGYTVSDGNGHGCTTDGATFCTVTGLTNGVQYTFTVTATNASGTSAPSTEAAVTPSGPPPAPTGVTAVVGDGQSTVTWTAPASDGGSPITGYTVTASNGATCTTGGELSCTVTGLPNLQAVTFTVTATNAAGTGPASEATEAVVPHSADFQVWVPNANIARGSGTGIYVFGATSVPSVRLKVGALNVTVSPNESGTAFYQFNPSSNSATRWAVQARAVRGQGKDKVALYASGAVYAPQVVMTKSWAWGSQLTASALKAAPGSNLAMAVNGTEVCRGTADSAGKLACTLDWTPPSAGDYTLTLQYGGADIASRTFTVRAPKR